MWPAEEWAPTAPGDRFDLEFFNLTGVLDRTALEQRMKLFR